MDIKIYYSSQTRAEIQRYSVRLSTIAIWFLLNTIADYLAPIVYWSLIESAVGIIAACLPLLLPLVRGISIENLQGGLKRGVSLCLWKRRSQTKDVHGSPAPEQNTEHPTPVLKDESGWLKAYQNSYGGTYHRFDQKLIIDSALNVTLRSQDLPWTTPSSN